MKKYVINGRQLFLPIGGLTRYQSEILKRLDEKLSSADIKVDLYCYKRPSMDLRFKHIHMVVFDDTDSFQSDFMSMKQQVMFQIAIERYARKEKATLVGMTNELCFKKDSITCIHDIMPLVMPEMRKQKQNKRFKLLGFCARHYAKYVITDSEYSSEQISKILDIPKSKLRVSYCGWEHVKDFDQDLGILETHPEMKPNQFYYSLSTSAPNKNFHWIFENAKSHPDQIFVVAGDVTCDAVRPSNLILLGKISDEQNMALMSNCKAFLFPSLLEGFGIPPLEAISQGRKIGISDIPVFREIYGNSAFYFSPFDYHVSLSLLEEQGKGENLLEKYTWDYAAEVWYRVLTDEEKR
jgi:glycosyltransferase involved in cell wall biosynthesis